MTAKDAVKAREAGKKPKPKKTKKPVDHTDIAEAHE